MTMLGQMDYQQGTLINDYAKIPDYKKGIILQTMTINRLMLVKDALHLFNFVGADASKYIKDYKLESLLKQKVTTLSGGEKQKVMLALTLQNNPEIFL